MTTFFADMGRTAAWLALILAVSAGALEAQSQEELARRRLDSGRQFLRSKQYKEAVTDFQTLLQIHPKTSVSDDALLEIATYQLEIAQDLKSADGSADTLLKEYPDSDSAPVALVLKGRVALAGGYSPEQVNAAIASFDRVSRLYEGTDAVPQAMYFAGEAARLGGRRDDAIERFGRLATQYPASPWTSRALIGSASSLVSAGQAIRAMEQLQRIRQQFPTSPEAETAREWNTILYRLYVRAPAAQPAYLFNAAGSPAVKLRDVRDLAIDPGNNLRVTTKVGVTTVTAKGAAGPPVPVQDARGMFFNRQGRMLTIHEEGALREEGRPGIVLATTAENGKVKPLDIEAGIATASGELIVADREMKALLRYSGDGKPLGEFARQIAARRLAIGELDDIAALDTDAKTVTIFNRDGKIVGRIPERGTGYQFRQPVDIAFDRLGHVYVLDRAAVFVFSAQGATLLTTFTVPERSPGAFTSAEALALDSAARLFLFDGRTDLVQVYR